MYITGAFSDALCKRLWLFLFFYSSVIAVVHVVFVCTVRTSLWINQKRARRKERGSRVSCVAQTASGDRSALRGVSGGLVHWWLGGSGGASRAWRKPTRPPHSLQSPSISSLAAEQTRDIFLLTKVMSLWAGAVNRWFILIISYARCIIWLVVDPTHAEMNAFSVWSHLYMLRN